MSASNCIAAKYPPAGDFTPAFGAKPTRDLPFETVVLGVAATVKNMNVTAAGDIVALCCRGRERQAIPILALPLPHPPPAGGEWVAYRRWARGQR